MLKSTPFKARRAGREDLIEQDAKEYGVAIRALAIASIFPDDMPWKNFGVTRYGRVAFHDDDEIEHMTDCNFRRIPPAPDPEPLRFRHFFPRAAEGD